MAKKEEPEQAQTLEDFLLSQLDQPVILKEGAKAEAEQPLTDAMKKMGISLHLNEKKDLPRVARVSGEGGNGGGSNPGGGNNNEEIG